MKNFGFSRAGLFSTLYVIAFMLISGALFAQSTFNLNGTFEGVRKQFDTHHQKFIQEFEYRYDLVQTGDVVEGVSTIYSENGEYAEVKLKGLVVGDKFYFEEYEIVDEMKSSSKVWCYKMGVLQIERKEGYVQLTGETESVMSYYGLACTGGYTEIAKVDESPEVALEEKEGISLTVENIDVYPNPTSSTTQISFDLASSNKVSIEVFDITGRSIQKVSTGKKSKGKHQQSIDISEATPGMYIVKITVGKDVYSKQIIKTEK